MSTTLLNKKILLGVCGSIAAYKAVFLLRELQREGAEVRVVMSPAATQFVTPLTFSSLSGGQTFVEMFPAKGQAASSGLWHIDLGTWADSMLIAPITASTIAKIAHGIADNLLTSIVLALRAPLIVAPAMDVDMYNHPTTVSNLASLKERGVFVIEPDEGSLASGIEGVGRLAEVGRTLRELTRFFDANHRDLQGKKLLVTAGPTQEPIDAVRFISNRSSGKMGFAIAKAASNRGADVRLITGPVALETPRNVVRIDVSTADEMLGVVGANLDWCDVLVMNAAVADYKVVGVAENKLKKEDIRKGGETLKLVENTDILKAVSPRKGKRVFVGFALETDNDIRNATNKLKAKSLDMIVLNNPRTEGAGFGTDTNVVTLLSQEGGIREDLPLLPKYDVAMKILDRILPLISMIP